MLPEPTKHSGYDLTMYCIFMCVHYNRSNPLNSPLNSSLNCPLSPDEYVRLANLKYLNCICDAVIFVSIFDILHFICVTQLFKMLLSQISKIPCDICHAHTFRTIGKIDVVAICSRLFKICEYICGDCTCLSYIFPFVGVHNVTFARIICGPRKFCARLYICARIYGHHGPIKVT